MSNNDSSMITTTYNYGEDGKEYVTNTRMQGRLTTKSWPPNTAAMTPWHSDTAAMKSSPSTTAAMQSSPSTYCYSGGQNGEIGGNFHIEGLVVTISRQNLLQ